MARFPAPETVADPLVFFHPRVYCWLSLGRALVGDRAGAHRQRRIALELAQSRRAHFDVLAAKVIAQRFDPLIPPAGFERRFVGFNDERFQLGEVFFARRDRT